MTVRLAGRGRAGALKRALTTNPALSVTVERQSDYYNRRSAQFSDVNDALVYGVSALLGLGALLAAVNILYSAVTARRREIATLRALGFGGLPVALAVAVEGILLALAGAAIGAGIAYGLFNGAQDIWYNNVFHLIVSPGDDRAGPFVGIPDRNSGRRAARRPCCAPVDCRWAARHVRRLSVARQKPLPECPLRANGGQA